MPGIIVWPYIFKTPQNSPSFNYPIQINTRYVFANI